MTQVFEHNFQGVSVLRIVGNLSSEGLADIEDRFDELAVGRGIHVVVDLGRVAALATSAISLMLKTARAVEAGGGVMVLANLTPEVQRIFACCRLELVMNLASDVAAGVEMARSLEPSGIACAR